MMMKMLPEENEFGLMHWRLLSRKINADGKPVRAIYVLPITGVGTWLRTVIDGRWEEPILIKTALVLEVIREVPGSGLVDARGQIPEPEYQCVNREMISVDVAKRRFQPKGANKGQHQDLEIVPGSLLTQEQRPQPMAMSPEMMKRIAAAEAKAAIDRAAAAVPEDGEVDDTQI
jgi:hypothetical protein